MDRRKWGAASATWISSRHEIHQRPAIVLVRARSPATTIGRPAEYHLYLSSAAAADGCTQTISRGSFQAESSVSSLCCWRAEARNANLGGRIVYPAPDGLDPRIGENESVARDYHIRRNRTEHIFLPFFIRNLTFIIVATRRNAHTKHDSKPVSMADSRHKERDR